MREIVQIGGRMATISQADVTLEDDLPEIARLNELRERAIDLREEAIVNLASICNGTSTTPKKWTDPSRGEEPDDLSQPSNVVLALGRWPAIALDESHLAERNDASVRLLEAIADTASQDILFHNDASATLELKCGDVPILQCARALQALVDSRGYAFTRVAMLCYYRLVRELYAIQPPEWMAGSARATPGGCASTFTTGECTRAISAVARSMEKAADLIEATSRYVDHRRRIALHEGLPSRWSGQELRRIGMAFFTTFSQLLRDSGLELHVDRLLPASGSIDDNFATDSDLFERFLRHFAVELQSTAERAVRDTALAVRELAAQTIADPAVLGATRAEASQRRQEAATLATAASSSEAIAEAFSHIVGARSVDVAHALATFLNQQFAQLVAAVPSSSTCGSGRAFYENIGADYFQTADAVVKRLRKQAERVRRLLAPAIRYFGSVLDREVAAASGGQHVSVNFQELAFAAAAYARLQRDYDDPRVLRAAELLEQNIMRSGRFDTESALDTDHRGYSLDVLGSEVLRAMATVLEKLDRPVSPATVERMMTLFEETAVRTDDGRLVGWTHDRPRQPRKAARWTSALGILALDRMARMLDERINARVSQHFSVRTNDQLRLDSPTLNQLFMPDYGRATSYRARGDEPLYTYLERMRSHIVDVRSIPGYDDALYSAVFHGPPGTGKTTLLEALARTSGAFLVEITPSDIVLAGEAGIERRSRAVFQALSYLSGCVVVFDEFDPILQDREFENLATRTTFSFLTPGMLPKLKTLNVRAAKQRVAYGLITNRIGILDPAAIRSGRFDAKVGVFPPDPLSRVGRFMDECQTFVDSLGTVEAASVARPNDARLVEAIVKTGGTGMTIAAQKGNFTKPRSIATAPKTSIFGYVFADGDHGSYEDSVKDAELRPKLRNPAKPSSFAEGSLDGRGQTVADEWRRWAWIEAWDAILRQRYNNNSMTWDALRELADSPPTAYKGKVPPAARTKSAKQ